LTGGLVSANGVNAAKFFQLFVKKRVVAINREISDAFYNSLRIRIDGIFVYQSFELSNFKYGFL